jgi:hypothetical protein
VYMYTSLLFFIVLMNICFFRHFCVCLYTCIPIFFAVTKCVFGSILLIRSFIFPTKILDQNVSPARRNQPRTRHRCVKHMVKKVNNCPFFQ